MRGGGEHGLAPGETPIRPDQHLDQDMPDAESPTIAFPAGRSSTEEE